MVSPAPANSLLLLGKDFPRFGELHVETGNVESLAAAISAGATEHTPARRSKGSAEVPNEDALLARCDGDLVLLAVADAHFGHRASHELLRALDRDLTRIPPDPVSLAGLLENLPIDRQDDGSESTLLVVVHDRARGQGFGYSFGDSAVAVVGPGRAEFLSRPTPTFVALRRGFAPRVEEAESLLFFTDPSDLVLVCTDGIHECHYRKPESSIGTQQLAECHAVCGGDPEAFVKKLARWALRGVGGNPGGQDNLAVIGSQAAPCRF